MHLYVLFGRIFLIFSEALCVSSLELHPGGLNYSLALQRHTGQTAVLQALTLGHMRSNNYSMTKIFVDNLLLSTLSIMPTNRCSPTNHRQFVGITQMKMIPK